MNHQSFRRRLFVAAGFCGVVGLSFLAGKYLERLRNGRWYQVHDSQAYPSKMGTFYLRHVTDTTGFPFLDPGNSVLLLDTPTGDVTLYNSKRMFQEAEPWVDKVEVGENDVRWSDGVYRFVLTIEKMGPTTQP